MAADGSGPGDAEDPLGENLIGNPRLELGSDGFEGWYFWADEGLAAEGSRHVEGRRALLHTEILEGSKGLHARWWFEPVHLRGGSFYEYEDEFRSYGVGRIIWSCDFGERRSFHWVGQTESSREWRSQRVRFFVPRDCRATVMHLLDRPGHLQTRSFSLRKVAARPLKKAFISFAFDDGRASNFSFAAEELERRGWRGSFYLIADALGADGFMKPEEAGELAARGHEIASHSASHRPLGEVPAEELHDEVEGSLRRLESLGARGGFAYPFGEFDEVVEPYVAGRARYVRTSLEGLNDAAFDLQRILVHPVTSETSDAELRQAVEDVARTRTWLVFLFHDFGEAEGEQVYLRSRSSCRRTTRKRRSSARSSRS